MKKSPVGSWRSFFNLGKSSSVSKRKLQRNESEPSEMKAMALKGERPLASRVFCSWRAVCTAGSHFSSCPGGALLTLDTHSIHSDNLLQYNPPTVVLLRVDCLLLPGLYLQICKLYINMQKCPISYSVSVVKNS